jgi:NAD(P)H-hydrate epimerase
VLVLAGNGHNAGDALLAAARLRERFPAVSTDVVFAFGEQTLRPLAARAWTELGSSARSLSLDSPAWASGYDLCLDGVFGFRFRPPLPEAIAALFARVNNHPICLRAAVDLPSGLDAPDAFRADFTYATGIAKSPLLTMPNAGRPRFIDLGFPLPENRQSLIDELLGADVLEPLRCLRAAHSDKRHYGHPLIVAGSRRYPGAAIMATIAALRAGAGLVTAAVPESLVPAFAAQAPEAIWLGLPETPGGGLALEGFSIVREAFNRATALVLGPGLGRERETLALTAEITAASPHPLVIDADALQPEIVAAGRAARILTPHAGEYARIAEALPVNAVVVRKGPITRIETAGVPDAPVAHSFFGGPVLSRGGSGDLLAGIAGTMLSQTPYDPRGAAERGVVWHGLAADALARSHGQVAVRTTQLLDFLAPALRVSDA